MYKSLQMGRAVAAMLVVLAHLSGAIAAEKYFGIPIFGALFGFGIFAGVEFFFVLSGFIMLTAHRQDISKPSKLFNYLKKRIFRIYPSYWIVFISVFLLVIASPTLRDTVPHDPIVIIKSLLLIPQDPALLGGLAVPVIIVAWTLQYEMIFYLCFGFSIINKWLSIAIATALLCLHFYFAGFGKDLFPFSLLAQDFIFLFIMGMCVSAACASAKSPPRRRFFWIIIGAIISLVLALDIGIGTNIFTDQRTILFGLASSFIIFALVKLEDDGRVIGGHPWLKILGDSSYALYLIHYPQISILCKFALLIHLNRLGFLGATITFVFVFMSCVAVAVLFHLFIEKPILIYLRNRFISREPAPVLK